MKIKLDTIMYMIVRVFISLLLLIFSISSPVIAAEVDCSAAPHNMVADNSNDQSDELESCLTAAAAESENIANIPTASGSYYKFTSSVTVPVDVSIVGADGAAFNMGSSSIILSNNSKIINIDFADGCKCVITPDNTLVTGAHIRNCSFGTQTSTSSVLLPLVKETIIDNNTFTNLYSSSARQNLTISGGQDNIITNNTFYGGKTCLIFKYYRTTNGNDTDSFFQGNKVMKNTLSYSYEECLTFDSNYNASYMPMEERDTVESGASGTSIVLADSGWDGGGIPDYTGWYMVPINGSALGQYRVITGHSGDTFTISSAFTNLSNGNIVSIMPVWKDNVIAFNDISHTRFTPAGILLFGNAFDNRIEHNDLNTDSISVRSLDHGPIDGVNVTGNEGSGPAGYNLIRENEATSEIYIIYRPVDSDYGSPYYTGLNAVVHNSISTTFRVYYQTNYYEGTSGESNENYGGYSKDDSGGTSTEQESSPLDYTDQSCADYGFTCIDDGVSPLIAHVSDLDASCGAGMACVGYYEGPILSDEYPTSQQPCDGSTSVDTIGVTSSENVNCKYSYTGESDDCDTAYASLNHQFTSGEGGTSHSFSSEADTCGTSVVYYLKCINGSSEESNCIEVTHEVASAGGSSPQPAPVGLRLIGGNVSIGPNP